MDEKEDDNMMGVEVGRFAAPATPAAAMSEDIAQNVANLMIFSGIEVIDSQKFNRGACSHLHTSIASFADAPEDVKAQGVMIKDALAQILSMANISRILIKPKQESMDRIKSAWDSAVNEANAANGSSAQGASSGDDIKEDDDSVVDVEDNAASEASVPEDEEVICIRS